MINGPTRKMPANNAMKKRFIVSATRAVFWYDLLSLARVTEVGGPAPSFFIFYDALSRSEKVPRGSQAFPQVVLYRVH